MAEDINESEENKGSFFLALGVGIGLTLLLELTFTFGLDPTTSLIARYISVMAGVIVTAVVAILGRGFIKSAFAGFITLLSSAILPFLLGFSSLYGIITPLVPTIKDTVSLLQSIGQLDSTTKAAFDTYVQYAVGLDLIFGLLISSFAGIGVLLVLKLFKKNPGILSIIAFVFGLIFLLIGALVLPWLFVGLSGGAHFGLGMVNGGLEMSNGLQIVQNNFTSDSASLASPYFDRANAWFDQAQGMLQDLRNLGMFWMVSLAFPQYANVIDDGSIVLLAGTDMVQAIGPFVAAGAFLNEGFQEAGASFTGTSSGLSLLQTESKFNHGISLLEAAFDNITDATIHIQDALQKISQISAAEMKQSLIEAGLQGNDKQIDMVFDGVTVLNATIGVLQVLINPLDNSPKAPLIHLLYGIRALSSAGDIIGKDSNFSGTSSIFEDVKTNLTVIQDALNTKPLLEFRNMNSSQFGDQIAQIQSTMAGAFNFFDDTTDIAIGFADFGQAMVPILDTMNSTLGILGTENLDLLSISDATFDNAISSLESMQTQSTDLVTIATSLQVKVDDMAQKSQNDTYGLLKSAAGDFAAQFTSFNLITNSQNFGYLSSGFAEVFKAAKLLKSSNKTVTHISNDIQAIVDASGNSTLQNETFFEKSPSISGNVSLADAQLANASVNIGYAQSNFSKAINDGNMTQLGNIDTILASINTHITNVRGDQGIGKIKTIMDDPAGYIQSKGGDISLVVSDLKGALDYIVSELSSITTDLSTLSIAK